MAIQELSEEQIRTWTLEEKDRWWLENVYRGDMPQLTLRSALTGMLLGGVLSLTNIYVGAKTGWTFGVGITSVILAFAMFKVLAKMQMANEFTILENNAMQSIATAAGYMTSPMISSLTAYMMVTGKVIPMWQTVLWITVLAILGVLFAFPFKRRFINDEQQPFPEGRAAGVVMDSLHHGDAEAGLLKAKLLLFFGGLAALIRFLQSEVILAWLHLKALAIPEFLDEWFYKKDQSPKLLGTPINDLGLRFELDLTLVGAGGLMGIRTGVSILLGAFINTVVLAPLLIQQGEITPNAAGQITFGRITLWSLWCGVGMMTIASLYVFFSKPDLLIGAFRNAFGKKEPAGGTEGDKQDILGHIELPLAVSIAGIPLLGIGVVLMAWSFFGVEPWLSVIAIVLVFVFCLIAINSTGLTSITPIGAMAKLTQLTFGAIAPGNREVNLMTAGITGEVASHSANLLQDIKPGYMLGAKPRQQAIGHVLGVIAGAVASVPVFYLVILRLSPSVAFAPDIDAPYAVNHEEFPMIAASIWKAVADVLTQGLHNIRPSAQIAAVIGIVLGLGLEWYRVRSNNKFPLSPVGIGLGIIIPFYMCLSMFLGSFIFWIIEKRYGHTEGKMNDVFVKNQEPICAGLIAGWALMGIAVKVVEVFLPEVQH